MASNYEKRQAKLIGSLPTKAAPTPIALPEENIWAAPVERYDRIAYDVFYDDEQRKFVRVTVEYNLATGSGHVKETKAIADSQPVAIYKMGETINRKILNLPEKHEG